MDGPTRQRAVSREWVRIYNLDKASQAAALAEIDKVALRIWAEKDNLLSVAAKMKNASEQAEHLVRWYLSVVLHLLTLTQAQTVFRCGNMLLAGFIVNLSLEQGEDVRATFFSGSPLVQEIINEHGINLLELADRVATAVKYVSPLIP